ncbi:MAG: glycosyltransferase family 4 protein [Flavobacteriales bacterium]|nr:glycosyltransferase family 4 protein [Flavobacteriales bacterium]
MKLLFLHRSKSFGGFSFEELFTTIKPFLKTCEIIDYYNNPKISFIKNIKQVRKINSDVIHIIGGLGYFSLLLSKRKTIVTFHDTNHLEFDLVGLKKFVFKLVYYTIPIKRAKYITVVSNYTKERVISLFNIDEKKLVVIPNCYPLDFKTKEKKKISDCVKILQIGTKSNKNIFSLIKAIVGLNIELTIIGRLNDELIELLKKYNINYINKFNLSREEIYNEYVNTDILAFISLREGFGLPILEANIVGRAIITSNQTSLPEVAGDSAHIVNPYNIDEIRSGIIKLSTNDEYRNQLIINGFQNLKRYSPEITSSLYFNLYKSIVSE